MQEGAGRVVKVAATSDTHGNLTELRKAHEEGLEGDIFIHAGDFTAYNKRDHFGQFVALLKGLRFQHKLVIPGNHEILLDPNIPPSDHKYFGIFHIPEDMSRESQLVRLAEAGATYLEHDLVELGGVRVFASAYTQIPPYWFTAFQVPEEKMDSIWEAVPPEIDLLVTHGPAHEILDTTMDKKNVGSTTIRKYLESSQAQAHVFGHIHEAKGRTKFKDILCLNVAERVHEFEIRVGG